MYFQTLIYIFIHILKTSFLYYRVYIFQPPGGLLTARGKQGEDGLTRQAYNTESTEMLLIRFQPCGLFVSFYFML